MFEILGQSTVEGVALGTAGTVIVTVAALLIKRGFSVKIGGGNSNNGHKGSVCPLHDEFVKRLDERHGVVVSALREIHDSQKRLHERFDEFVKPGTGILSMRGPEFTRRQGERVWPFPYQSVMENQPIEVLAFTKTQVVYRS